MELFGCSREDVENFCAMSSLRGVTEQEDVKVDWCEGPVILSINNYNLCYVHLSMYVYM